MKSFQRIGRGHNRKNLKRKPDLVVHKKVPIALSELLVFFVLAINFALKEMNTIVIGLNNTANCLEQMRSSSEAKNLPDV